MSLSKDKFTEEGPDNFIRICHLFMLLFGIAAVLTGDMAGDYKKVEHLGFMIHGWAGMGLASFVLIYIAYGIAGPADSRFSKWVPFNRERIKLVKEDLTGLIMKCKLPERKSHEGLAGAVQFLGILAFSGLALTGSIMFFMLETGGKTRGIMHAVKEVHEAGAVLVIIYLIIHVGAVVLHSFAGNHVWMKMFTVKDSGRHT